MGSAAPPRAGASLWLYRVLLTGVLPVAAPALWLQARLRGKSRPPISSRLLPATRGLVAGGLWLQAVSVGEVEVARRLVAELGRRVPGLPLVVTSTTATGLALARATLADRTSVLPCPLDLPWPVRALLDAARPRALVLVETELWPELLHQSARRAVPVAVVNGRISDRAFERYLTIRRPMRRLLGPVALVLAQSAADAERFARIGVPEQRVRVTGNVKYDLEPSLVPLPWQEQVQRWAGERPLLVAGSTLDGEEAAVLDAVAELGGPERLFLVLAPRHPERFPVAARLLSERGVAFAARSRLDDAPARVDALLLDTIGELARAYRLARVAFVGGSLTASGGHNPLEPAVWSVPVVSGAQVDNFREAYDLLVTAGGARLVDKPSRLAATLADWLGDPARAATAGRAAVAVVEGNRGATARTVAEVLTLAGLDHASGSD
jgi:3-deoxy-D-manno-octulosonic-acid transferase